MAGRAAKLVLRIALEQLTVQYGLDAAGQGRERGVVNGWCEERLPLILRESQD